jgi:hypothetical protein
LRPRQDYNPAAMLSHGMAYLHVEVQNSPKVFLIAGYRIMLYTSSLGPENQKRKGKLD